MSIIDHFKGKKKVEVDDKKTLTKDESIRELERIQGRLKEIQEGLENIEFDRFPMSYISENEKEKTKERLDNIKNQVKNFLLFKLKKTDSAELAKLSTDKVNIIQIEEHILFFAQNLNQAINEGNISKAEACMVGLGYGVQQGHKPVPDSNRDTLDKEMSMRYQKLEKYRGIVSLTQQIAERKNGVELLQKKFDEKQKVFDKAWEIYDYNRKSYPQRYQGLKYLTGSQKDSLTPEQLKAYEETNYIQNTVNELKRIKKEIAVANISIEECGHHIENLDNAAIMLSFQIDYSLQQKIDEASAVITQKTGEVLNDIIASQESLDRLQKEFDAIFDAKEFREMVANAAIKAEKIDNENYQKLEEDAVAAINYQNAMQAEADKIDKIKNEAKQKAEQKAEHKVQHQHINKKRNTNSMF